MYTTRSIPSVAIVGGDSGAVSSQDSTACATTCNSLGTSCAAYVAYVNPANANDKKCYPKAAYSPSTFAISAGNTTYIPVTGRCGA